MARDLLSVGSSNHNLITSGTKIIGNIISESDFRMDGEIEGDIFSKGKVIIGQKGQVNGNISCKNAEVLGLVNGDLQVFEALTLRASCQINGNVVTKSLTIEPNAAFNGSCSMKEASNNKPE